MEPGETSRCSCPDTSLVEGRSAHESECSGGFGGGPFWPSRRAPAEVGSALPCAVDAPAATDRRVEWVTNIQAHAPLLGRVKIAILCKVVGFHLGPKRWEKPLQSHVERCAQECGLGIVAA